MIAVVDYGAGNIQSVLKALEYIGCDCRLTDNKEEIESASGVLLPGVGSFGDAMGRLRRDGLDITVKEAALSGKPFLGICLGLQLLFEGSEESPGVEGLGLLKGKILKIPEGLDMNGDRLKVPHMGWNSLNIKKRQGLFCGIYGEPYVYFVHSYYLKAEEDIVAATTEYGLSIDAAVCRDNIFACQFHPEKSGERGMEMLKNFKRMCGDG